MRDQRQNDSPSFEGGNAPERKTNPHALSTTIAVAAELSGYFAEMSAHQALIAGLRPANKTALFDCLATSGIARIVVSFDGCGDSGQIESIEARNAAGGVVELPAMPMLVTFPIWGHAVPEMRSMPLAEAIEHLAYDALSETHGGWENDDGAYGEFVFDVAERTITLDYNERYIATESFSHTF